MTALNIQALMALSAANVATDLWHWEYPLMGGGREAMATFSAIDWTKELSSNQLEALVSELQSLGMILAANGVAEHEASDNEILIALGRVDSSLKWEIVSRQVSEWNALAEAAIAANNITIESDDDIDGFLKIENFKGSEPDKAIADAIAKFGEEAVTAHAVKKITTSKNWWDYADYLKGAAYEAADKAYAEIA